MKTRRILAMLLAVVMLCALAACSNSPSAADNSGSGNQNQTDGQPDERRYETTRDIYVGEWWEDGGYHSDKTALRDDESNPMVGQMRLDTIRAIEEKYNVRFYQVNMTWDGARESINTSIVAGTPDCDIYAMDLQFAIPVVVSNYCMPISSYATDKNGDIYTDQIVLTKMNVCGLPEDYIFKASPALIPNDLYSLGFNWTLLQEYGLENPQDLWDRGEWTWDKWLEMMKTVTDTSKTVPVYGWCGEHNRSLENLLISNGANIAMTDTQMITSPAAMEVFDFIYKLNNEHNVSRWDSSAEYWDNSKYNDGTLAFFTFAPWLAQRFGTSQSEDCPYEILTVPWPIGPSGNKDTNNTSNMSGNVYMIPVGTKDPDIVYDVYFDYNNWFNYDTSLRDDFTWMQDLVVDERSFDYMLEYCKKPQFDMWNMLGIQDADGNGFSTMSLSDGSSTPSQFAESWKNVIQDYIDKAYGK